MFIVNPNIIPYQLSCILQDEGMLPDAYLNSLQRKEYGQEFIRKNAHFLTDYLSLYCSISFLLVCNVKWGVNTTFDTFPTTNYHSAFQNFWKSLYRP